VLLLQCGRCAVAAVLKCCSAVAKTKLHRIRSLSGWDMGEQMGMDGYSREQCAREQRGVLLLGTWLRLRRTCIVCVF